MSKALRVVAGVCAATFTYVATVAPEVGVEGRSSPPCAISLMPVAQADNADLGFAILKCFHPTADFVRATFGTPFQDAPGRMAQAGHIDFRGGFTSKSYTMDFTLQTTTIGGDRMMRVIPGADTAPFVPDPGCRFRDWTRTG